MSKNCNHPTCFDSEYCRREKKPKKVYKLKRTSMKKAATKKKKEKKPSMPALMAKAQKIFNGYIRERDSENGFFTCISCGKEHPVSKMNAGHYVPVSKCSFLRFNEWNCNGEDAGCNCFDEFHLIGYRKNLIGKIGQDAVEWLEANRHTTKRWTREELNQIINTYGNVKRTDKAA